MRLFYAFWFFFCASWGYLLAGSAEPKDPAWGQLAASFPIALLTFVVLFWLQLRGMPPGKLAQSPSLTLKPWDRPTGFSLFIGITFVFVALWGVAIAALAHLPGLLVAVSVLPFGAGTVGAIFVCRHAFPDKFST